MRDVPWLDEVQRGPTGASAEARRPDLLRDDAGRAITSAVQWNVHRVALRRAWLDFLKPLKLPRLMPKLEVIEEDRPEGCVRQLVRYETEPGETVEGYLLRPEKINGRVPGVVALHSTYDQTIRQPAGVEGAPEKAFALRLAHRGMVSFCPRCFLWPATSNADLPRQTYMNRVHEFQRRHPGSLGMAKMLWDASRALDVLESLPEVDPNRLGAVGHSLGAKESLYLMAFDERVAAAVSSEGGLGTRQSNWEAAWYLGPAIRDGRFTREHDEVLALCAPRPMLIVGGESADGEASWPLVESALTAYRLYGKPARVGLFNHRGGHAVPPEAERRIYEWLEAYLG